MLSYEKGYEQPAIDLLILVTTARSAKIIRDLPVTFCELSHLIRQKSETEITYAIENGG
jgi:hypothetical protein